MSFQKIKGQEKSIEILKEYIKQDHLGNGYLFVGPEGIGKGLVAKTLAKAINCQTGPLDSCDRCSSCLKIDKNQHPDIHLIDEQETESIKIEYIRQLQRDISLRPYEAKKKVFIIDNAHNFTGEAANAILKILEEPPRDSLFILITDKPALLFKTIISRCRILKFSSLPRTILNDTLIKDYSLDETLAHFLAYFCEGRIGRALKLKDTDILIKKNIVIDEFIFPYKTVRDTKAPGFQVKRQVYAQAKKRDEVRDSLNILATWFRDIYLIRIGLPYSQLIHLDRKSELLKTIQHFSFLELDEILNLISDSLLYLTQNANIKLLLSNLREEINSSGKKYPS